MYEANKYAISIPLKVLETTAGLLGSLKAIAEKGNENAVSDAGVGALLVDSGVKGAALNVKINLKNFSKDDPFYVESVSKMNSVLQNLDKAVKEILDIVEKKVS